MTFGGKLQRLRSRAGLSQDQLAELLDVSRQAVSKWERDEAMPEAEKIVRISRQFRVSTDYLLLEEREEPEEPRTVRRSLEDWFRDWCWLLGIPMALYGLWQLRTFLVQGSYLLALSEMYNTWQVLAILLTSYYAYLAAAVGWIAAGVVAAVAGFRRAGRLCWYHAGAPLMAGGAGVALVALLAWVVLVMQAPELLAEMPAAYAGTLLWGLALALAGGIVLRLGRRGKGRRHDGAGT